MGPLMTLRQIPRIYAAIEARWFVPWFINEYFSAALQGRQHMNDDLHMILIS